jgi:hypothetical protein
VSAGHELIEVFNDPLGGRLELEDMCDGQDNGPGVPEFLEERKVVGFSRTFRPPLSLLILSDAHIETNSLYSGNAI